MYNIAAKSFYLALFAYLGTSHGVHASPNRATQSNSVHRDVCALDPRATVSDACASYSDLDRLNSHLSPFINKLVTKTDFFSYYRLNLYNKVCPFWSDENGLCGNIACAVTTLENENDIPAIWRAKELSRLEGPKAQHPGKKEQRERPQKPLMGELGENVGESCVVEYDDECDDRDYCVPEDESVSAKGDYVSLVDNPERFTGYAGEGAQQVWDGIYRENCFSKSQTGSKSGGIASDAGSNAQASLDFKFMLKEHNRQQALQTGSVDDQTDLEDECLEKRVFYRVISGMHASISTHLCHDYLNQTTGEWGPNLQCYKERLHQHPERISNLYFNYAMILRAVGKLKDYVQDYTFCTGDPIEDRRTKQLIKALAEVLPSGPEIFDESVMFRDNDLSDNGITLKEDFRNRFRNISRIMDCVGCDKCRLWGKLQTAGYGTALKVLFEFGHDDPSMSKPLLRRTELVALINTLDKISQALKHIAEFRGMIEAEVESKGAGTVPVSHEEDDLYDSRETERQKPKEVTLTGVFWEEWYRVWRVYGMVWRSWFAVPGKVFTITIGEIDRLWSYWLGLPVRPRSWEFKFPHPDEL